MCTVIDLLFSFLFPSLFSIMLFPGNSSPDFERKRRRSTERKRKEKKEKKKGIQHEGSGKKKNGKEFTPRTHGCLLSQIMGSNWSARTGVSADGDQKISANEAGAETIQTKELAHDPSDLLWCNPNQEEEREKKVILVLLERPEKKANGGQD
ncbi:hypothetical protein L873DRAFT_144734 [Choiromyces venosus 120613-1]|uniref:Uncharacterized protein n=1 Tax=Choiromyces venosus 120613-1 TaxID=1336337 RepID=A0A3N4J8I1_9PEZI|nr:hypothetical protein L873DRAFT_144734 [Choiromyces venosus 120613-1]